MSDLTIKSFENPVQLPGLTGGQGVLYLARYKGGEVVLKVMSVSPEAAARAFKTLSDRTAQLMALNHSGVVRYVGCFGDKSQFSIQHFVVTEYLKGETLKQHLARESAGIGSVEVIRLAQTCLRTLTDLAAAGVLHRDLTPSNIFVESNTPDILQTAHYKLIDFEVGKFMDPTSSGNTTTSVGVGKQDYMAPELFGSVRASERSDIFTFALTLHEALTGKLPYKRGTLRQANETITPLPCVDHLIPGLGSILERCFARAPADRPGSFAELFAAIQPLEPGFLSGTPPRRYKLLSLVGEGGFGQVYKAVAVEGKDEFVAVKHLTQPRYADRFEREAKTLQQFNDSRIVRFVDYFRIGRNFGDERFLVMQYLAQMPGSSLRERIKAARVEAEGAHVGLKAGEVNVAFVRYAEGLACLHAVDVFHRDIKPANLYLPAGRPECSCIMDLGIVRNEDATHTQGGGVPGSPDYMAPEFVNASGGRGSSASDVYALGLCLFEALTGRYLFGRHSKKEDIWNNFFKRATEQPAPNFAPLERVAIAYVRLVERMTVYEVEDRADISEVIRALRGLAGATDAGRPKQGEQHEVSRNAETESDASTMTQPAAAMTAATVAAQFPLDATLATVAVPGNVADMLDATLATVAVSEAIPEAANPEPVAATPSAMPEEAKPVATVSKEKKPRGPSPFTSAAARAKSAISKFPFAVWAKRAAIFLLLVGIGYASVVYLPPAFRDFSRQSADRRDRRVYDAVIADAQSTADALTATAGATPTPDAFASLPAALLAAQSNLSVRLSACAPGIRNSALELQISNQLVKATDDYSSILARLTRTLVDDCVAAYQRGDSAHAEKQAEVWQGWRRLLAPAVMEAQADQIASAKGEYQKGVALREQMARDAELARLNEPMPIRFDVPEDVAADPSFKREYDASGRWLLATDSLKLVPGQARFRFSRADYEPIVKEATVESQKPLTVACDAEWTPTAGHARFLALRGALVKLRAADAKSSDLEAAVKLVDGTPPVLADAARKNEWNRSTAEVKKTEREYLMALEEHRILEAFVKELNALAADPSRIAASRLEFPDRDIVARPEVKKAAAGVVAAVTNRVVASLADEPLDTRTARMTEAGAFLRSENVARFVGIADETAPRAVKAAQDAIDAAEKAIFVRVWNRTSGELRIENRAGKEDGIAAGKSRVVKLTETGAVRFEASIGEDYLPGVKTVDVGRPGVFEVSFAQADFAVRPAGITLAAGDAPNVSVTLADASGKTLATAFGSVEVPPGEYTVRFTRPDHIAQTRTVTVAPRKMLTLLPEVWHHETAKLVLSYGESEDAKKAVTFKLVAQGASLPVEVKAGENIVDTGKYTLTFSRTGGVDQSEPVEIIVGKSVEKSPGAWKPKDEYIARLKGRAFGKLRADVQKAAGVEAKKDDGTDGAPDVPDWIARAVPADTLLGEADSKMLSKLQDIYMVMGDAPSQPLTMDRVEEWEQLLAAGYEPNSGDEALMRRALSVWDAHNKTIQNAGATPQRTKDAALQAVERIRKLHVEIVRRTEEKKVNEN